MNNLLAQLLWFLLMLPTFLMAEVDSLSLQYQQIQKQSIKPEVKIDSLIAFAVDNLYKNDSIAGLAMYAALDIADKNDLAEKKGKCFSLLSWREEKFGNIRQALRYAQEAIEILKERPPGHTLIWTYNHAGWISRRLMERGKAMEYAMQALQFAEQTSDTTNIGSAYNTMAALYVELQDYDKALEYHRQSLYWRELAGNSISIAQSHGNMGIVYMRMERYEEALKAHKRGLKVAQEASNMAEVAFFYNDIGSTYLYKGDIDSSIHYLRKSIAMREEMKEMNEIAYTYNYLGEAYEKAGHIEEGERWIKKALQVAIDIENSKQNYEALESLSDFYARNQQYDSAYVYLHKHKLYGDSIHETRQEELIHELAAQYETEKKEQQIEILNREKAIQQLKLRQRNLLLVGTVSVLLLVMAGVYLWQNRLKTRTEARLQRQAVQDVLQAEERERRRIATDLHDGVGQMLSAALLNLNDALGKTPKGTSNSAAEKALALLEDSYSEMRSISHQMMPNALLKAGLASSVREFLDKIDGEKIKVSLDVVGLDERLDEQTETVLYRVIQEAVNNVIKHAEASKLTIQLNSDSNGIDVTVEDNGQGFDKGNMLGFEGIGLRNIRSRVALLGGMLELDSLPGKGTLLAIHIPRK